VVPGCKVENDAYEEVFPMSVSYHEPPEELSVRTRDLHRALTSLTEELQAIDWYEHRIDATADNELKAILAHNRDEEVEHASMLLEYLRRQVPAFDTNLRQFLFTSAPIAHDADQPGAGREPSADLGIGPLRP